MDFYVSFSLRDTETFFSFFCLWMKSFLSHAGIEMRFYFPLIDLDIIYKKNESGNTDD